MCKFLSAILLALACAAPAAAAPRQVGVRVGPEAEESTPGAASAAAPEKEAKAGGDKKDARPANVKPPAPPNGPAKNDAKKDAGGGPNALAAGGAADAGKGPAPAGVTSAAAAAPPVGTGPTHATNATSDAPVRPGPALGIPAVNPAKGPGPANNSRGSAAPAVANSAATPPAAKAPVANPVPPAANPAPASPLPPPPPLTDVYRIGVGDVLDIRLLNQPDSRQSTLYTVLTGGLVEYPLVRDPVPASGMTAEELSAQLVAELRHRGVYERPQVRVSVREYASHAVIVSGLVNDPGTKILRREAVPLYVVVAESQPKPEAGRAVVISHATGKTAAVDLLDAAAMSLLVHPGDVVSINARPPEFFYVGGEIGSPGQKSFHAGMTLTQALLASGGATPQAGGRVKVLRQGPDGRLITAQYNLKEIEGGAAPDPTLQPGDRIEVARAAARK